MTHKEYTLVVLAEEVANLAAAANKALKFGLDHVEIDKGRTMRKSLTDNFNDVYAMMQILEDNNQVPFVKSRKRIRDKKSRFKAYLNLSKSRGIVK